MGSGVYMDVVRHTKKPTHKQAHLVLPTRKANAEKPKEPVFCQRSAE
jgi:hypothetical protein